MKLPAFSITLLVIIGLLSSCKDIIEPNISNRLVILEAPGNQYQSTSYNINFWWDAVDDALKYHLQVVTPGFKNIGGLVLDTVVTGNRFSINMQPGTYEWHIMAANGSSQTQFSSPLGFTIVQSSIKQQTVQLSAPGNNALTNQSAVVFQWGSLYGATKYQLEIDTNNFVNESAVIYNQSVPGQQVNFTFPKDNIYQWRVRAQNDTAQAQWSAVNTITYDHTPPAQVGLVAPANSLIVHLPVSLQWGAVASASRYKLYVFKSDSTTTYNSTFPLPLTTTSYNFNAGSSGDRVYWKVAAIDAAGNEGQPSVLRSFVLQ